MQGQFLIIGSAIVIALIIVIVILHLVRKMELKYYRNKVKNLEIERNIIASTPVLLELSKVEPIIKNDKMEEKYNEWRDKFTKIKEERLSLVDDIKISDLRGISEETRRMYELINNPQSTREK